jgi:hydrogenase maturation factor
VVVGPGFGLDAAAADLGPQCLILRSDPVTFTVAEVGFGLRPLGLIASGSLLLTISERRAGALLAAFGRRRVPAAVIGRITSGRGVRAYRAGRRVRFDWSPRDELTRLP